MPRGAWHGFRFHCDGWPRMPIETVLALEDISAKEGVVVRAARPRGTPVRVKLPGLPAVSRWPIS